MDLSYFKTVRGSKCTVPENLPQDLDDAMLLMQDYGGRVSETSALMQYMYQHYILSPVDKEIADILERIAIFEMQHHELLGKTITLLGGDPIVGADYKYWTAGYINYTRSLKEIIMVDINDEEQAIENYRKTIARLKNKDVARMIECIISDEELHIEVLTEILNFINENNMQ